MRSFAVSSTTFSATMHAILGHEKRTTYHQFRSFSSKPTEHAITEMVKTTTTGFSAFQAKAQSLLDSKASPLGSFQKSEFSFFKDFVRQVQKKKKVSSELIALEFQIMDRLVAELKENPNIFKSQSRCQSWICDERFWLPTFEQWRDNKADPTPADMWQRLQDWARQLPAFQCVLVGPKSGSLLLVLETAIQRTSNKAAAAQIAEDYLSNLFSWIHSKQCQSNHGVVLCNRVLEAWAQTDTETIAQAKIAQLLNDMRNSKRYAPNNETYDIVLRYYAKKTSTDNADRFIEDTLLHLQRENLQPSLSNLVSAIYGFSKAGRIDRAENLLKLSKQYVENSSNGSLHRNLEFTRLLKGTRFVLSAYAQQISKAVKKHDITMLDHLLERASVLYNQTLTMCMALDKSKQRRQQQPVAKLAASMMHCYACAQRLKAMEKVIADLMQRNYPMNASAYNRIIQTLGRHDRADRATAVLKHLLRNSKFVPALSLFNEVLDAWTQSTRPDSFEHATNVFELLSDHPKCKERSIRPDTNSYVSLLRCLADAEGKLRMEAGTRAMTLLNEIEAAANVGSLRLNRTCFNLVVKACLRSNEEGLAWDVINRMEKTKDFKPNIRTYNEILAFFSKRGTLQAARRADELLYELSKNANKTLPEDACAVVPNSHSYLAVANAWAKADCSQSARRLFSLYKHMVGFNVPLNQHIYIAMIRYLANDSMDSSVKHAQKILEDMEKNEQSTIRPDYRHYVPVLRGFIFNSKMKSANSILFRCVQSYIRTKNRSVAPNSAMVNMVVQGWMRDDDKIVQASEVANKMAQLRRDGKIPEGPDQSVFRSLLTQWKNFQLMHPDRVKYIRLLEARLEEVRTQEILYSVKSAQRFSIPR